MTDAWRTGWRADGAMDVTRTESDGDGGTSGEGSVADAVHSRANGDAIDVTQNVWPLLHFRYSQGRIEVQGVLHKRVGFMCKGGKVLRS
jgi:hypothetical protein